MNKNLQEKLKMLPKEPGCYLMKDINNVIIYVGKAKNLYNRVRSYFVGSHDAKTTRLVMLIEDFEYIITSSETEAFILEMNLIKKYDPKYNIKLTDDKIYPYIVITEDKNPKIFYTRERNYKGRYFGPYPNATAARDIVVLLNKIYPLRKCRKLPKKECLYYHLGQCLAPCINNIPKEKYNEIISKITSLLKGNIKDEIKRLELLMNEASDKLDYEKAMEYLNLIKELEVISEKQKMEFGINDTDIFNYFVDENNSYISIQVFHIRGSKMVERNGFLYEVLDTKTPNEMILDFLGEFYINQNNPLPNEILLPDIDTSSLNDEISKKIIIPKQGKKKELVDLVKKNAKEKLDILFQKEKNHYERTEGAIIKLQELLNIKTPVIIEAFDNSNIQGVSNVSAMVSYKNGVPNKKEYRKYKIKNQIDDALTMNEVITRRYRRLKQENLLYPDLIVIDGGRPQVNACLDALNKLDISIPVLGLVKNDNHKTDSLLYNNEDIYIDKKSRLFLFLESLQDEVHRYALSFHHNVHIKNAFASKLDQIKGIGKIKKQAVLKIIGDTDFSKKLRELKLNNKQIEEILKMYNPD